MKAFWSLTVIHAGGLTIIIFLLGRAKMKAEDNMLFFGIDILASDVIQSRVRNYMNLQGNVTKSSCG